MHELEVHGVHIRRVVVAMPFEKLSPGSQKVLLRLDRERKIRLEALNHSFGLEALRADDLPPQATGVPASPMQQSRPFAFGIEQQLSPAYLFWKRGFDIALSLLAIVCLLPPMLCVTAFVFFDVGYPVIFWQQRPGTRGRPIKVLKFRTMRSAYDSTGRRLPDSERLSPIGAFLRRMRVDELPQIFNVLTGEMSIIGPRPLLPIDQSPDFSARLEMRPGLTGWAQINGGRHLSIADKAALDLWYVNNASFRVDIRILLMTVRTVLFGERIDDRAIRSAWQTLGVEPAPTGEKDNAAADTVEMDHWYQPAPVPYPPGPQVRKC
jgi:lipopolysaccharide/colanic/teichoic acid biosynthesis glycosyltransferase